MLGLVLRAALGDQSLTDFLEKRLWTKAGFESDALWLLDNDVDAMELAFGTINAVTRDFARFGWLYVNQVAGLAGCAWCALVSRCEGPIATGRRSVGAGEVDEGLGHPRRAAPTARPKQHLRLPLRLRLPVASLRLPCRRRSTAPPLCRWLPEPEESSPSDEYFALGIYGQ